jgi:8-oxo-dGTP pyrophosphatase MutT (NUDIX family)
MGAFEPAGMSLLRQYRRHPMPDLSHHRRFIVDGCHVGWIRPGLGQRLAGYRDVFVAGTQGILLHPALASVSERSAAMAAVLADLRGEGLVPGWRDELYPVNQRFGQPPFLVMERAAAPLFGVLAYGVNLNGYVGRGWEMKTWIARRAADKSVDPNMLDLIAGGGQPLGLTLQQNLIKECHEEAGIPASLAERARPVGLVTLLIEAGEGLRVGQQFNYDLELPEGFQPDNRDGEVAGFELVPVSEILHRLRSADDFMYDVAIVLIDFLVRHGFVGPEDREYLPLVAGLRRPIPFDAEGGQP